MENININNYESERRIPKLKSYVSHSLHEREKMEKMESLDYKQIDNDPFRQWVKDTNLEKKNHQKTALKWVIYFLLGCTLGGVAYIVRYGIETLGNWKLETSAQYLRNGSPTISFFVFYSINLLFVTGSTFCVFIFGEKSSGSGIPEVKGYLNGVRVVGTINLKTFIGKLTSVILAYSSSLAIGPEGPMIHLGAMIGAGISGAKSKTLNFRLPKIFETLRNDKDQRDFIASGAAAGITAAFGAPIGGVLFALEDTASFWSKEMTWRTFFGCMIATLSVNVFLGGFRGSSVNDYGLLTFGVSRYSLYGYEELIFFILLGVIGGLLGTFFIKSNLIIMKWRRDYVGSSKIARFAEVWIIITLTVLLVFGISTMGTCHPKSEIKYFDTVCDNSLANQTSPHSFFCKDDSEYNELANLFFNQEEVALKLLFSRDMGVFNLPTLFVYLVVYFFLVTITSGISVASGLFVPMMLIGATFGRILGQTLALMFSHNNPQIDPSIYALVGSAAMMSGFSRITISLCVIVVELTENTQYLLPIMMAVMVAKWVSDFFCKPIYDELIELKSIPILESHPPQVANLIDVNYVMTKEVKCINYVESVDTIMSHLQTTKHNGFPVVRNYPGRKNVYLGFINRKQLLILLHAQTYQGLDLTPPGVLQYSHYLSLMTQRDIELSQIKLPPPSVWNDLFIDCRPYMDRSHIVIQSAFSFMEAYNIFKGLGLRQLPVVNTKFSVVGILTRQDFLKFHFGLSPENISYIEEEDEEEENEESQTTYGKYKEKQRQKELSNGSSLHLSSERKGGKSEKN